MSSCPQHHGGNRLGRRMNQHCLTLGFLIPALPHMVPTILTPCPQDEAGGLGFAHRGTEQISHSNHCNQAHEGDFTFLHASCWTFPHPLTVCPELPSSAKHKKPLEQSPSKQTASWFITGMHWLRIASSLCTPSLAPKFVNETSTNRMSNTPKQQLTPHRTQATSTQVICRKLGIFKKMQVGHSNLEPQDNILHTHFLTHLVTFPSCPIASLLPRLNTGCRRVKFCKAKIAVFLKAIWKRRE